MRASPASPTKDPIPCPNPLMHCAKKSVAPAPEYAHDAASTNIVRRASQFWHAREGLARALSLLRTERWTSGKSSRFSTPIARRAVHCNCSACVQTAGARRTTAGGVCHETTSGAFETCRPQWRHAIQGVQIGAQLGPRYAGQFFQWNHALRRHSAAPPLINSLWRNAQRLRDGAKATGSLDGSINCGIKVHAM